MVELLLLIFKIMAALLLIEGIVYGLVLVIVTKCISINHKEEWTEKWKGRLDDEGKDKGSKRLSSATEETGQDD